MAANLILRAGDTWPALTDRLTDSDGTALTLTGATINLVITRVGEATPTVNAAGTVLVPADPATDPNVEFDWAQEPTPAGLPLDPGGYLWHWAGVHSGGEVFSVPNDGPNTLRVF